MVNELGKRDIQPLVLYLQLDNTALENKNQYVLAFLAYLVQAGVFSAIHLSFLIVGHTHEDIDQVFSGVSAHLKKNSAYTLGDLEQAVYNNNRDVVPVTQLRRMLDNNSWLHCDTTSSYHSSQLSLRPGSGGKVVMIYRNWSSDQ